MNHERIHQLMMLDALVFLEYTFIEIIQLKIDFWLIKLTPTLTHVPPSPKIDQDEMKIRFYSEKQTPSSSNGCWFNKIEYTNIFIQWSSFLNEKKNRLREELF